eukprot:Sspe_Gene.59356::Locus_32588_Transcript_1_1_Confidence_1.000_Length_3114::g.59356::m.59356
MAMLSKDGFEFERSSLQQIAPFEGWEEYRESLVYVVTPCELTITFAPKQLTDTPVDISAASDYTQLIIESAKQSGVTDITVSSDMEDTGNVHTVEKEEEMKEKTEEGEDTDDKAALVEEYPLWKLSLTLPSQPARRRAMGLDTSPFAIPFSTNFTQSTSGHVVDLTSTLVVPLSQLPSHIASSSFVSRCLRKSEWVSLDGAAKIAANFLARQELEKECGMPLIPSPTGVPRYLRIVDVDAAPFETTLRLMIRPYGDVLSRLEPSGVTHRKPEMVAFEIEHRVRDVLELPRSAAVSVVNVKHGTVGRDTLPSNSFAVRIRCSCDTATTLLRSQSRVVPFLSSEPLVFVRENVYYDTFSGLLRDYIPTEKEQECLPTWPTKDTIFADVHCFATLASDMTQPCNVLAGLPVEVIDVSSFSEPRGGSTVERAVHNLMYGDNRCNQFQTRFPDFRELTEEEEQRAREELANVVKVEKERKEKIREKGQTREVLMMAVSRVSKVDTTKLRLVERVLKPSKGLESPVEFTLQVAGRMWHRVNGVRKERSKLIVRLLAEGLEKNSGSVTEDDVQRESKGGTIFREVHKIVEEKEPPTPEELRAIEEREKKRKEEQRRREEERRQEQIRREKEREEELKRREEAARLERAEKAARWKREKEQREQQEREARIRREQERLVRMNEDHRRDPVRKPPASLPVPVGRGKGLAPSVPPSTAHITPIPRTADRLVAPSSRPDTVIRRDLERRPGGAPKWPAPQAASTSSSVPTTAGRYAPYQHKNDRGAPLPSSTATPLTITRQSAPPASQSTSAKTSATPGTSAASAASATSATSATADSDWNYEVEHWFGRMIDSQLTGIKRPIITRLCSEACKKEECATEIVYAIEQRLRDQKNATLSLACWYLLDSLIKAGAPQGLKNHTHNPFRSAAENNLLYMVGNHMAYKIDPSKRQVCQQLVNTWAGLFPESTFAKLQELVKK